MDEYQATCFHISVLASTLRLLFPFLFVIHALLTYRPSSPPCLLSKHAQAAVSFRWHPQCRSENPLRLLQENRDLLGFLRGKTCMFFLNMDESEMLTAIVSASFSLTIISIFTKSVAVL